MARVAQSSFPSGALKGSTGPQNGEQRQRAKLCRYVATA